MNKWRMIVIAGLTLLMLVLVTFDVRARLFEDGSIRITMCIPTLICSQEYTKPDIEPLDPPDYGEVTLPTNHY